MFRWIIAGVAVVITIAYSYFKSGEVTGVCNSCGTPSYWPSAHSTCAVCGALTCSSCLDYPPTIPLMPTSILEFKVSGLTCPTCRKVFDPYMVSYNAAVEVSKSISVFPATYKGETGINRTQPTQKVTSDWFADYQDAERQLSVACAYLDYQIVVDVQRNRDTSMDGNYTYSVWQAVGIAGHIGRS